MTVSTEVHLFDSQVFQCKSKLEMVQHDKGEGDDRQNGNEAAKQSVISFLSGNFTRTDTPSHSARLRCY